MSFFTNIKDAFSKDKSTSLGVVSEIIAPGTGIITGSLTTAATGSKPGFLTDIGNFFNGAKSGSGSNVPGAASPGVIPPKDNTMIYLAVGIVIIVVVLLLVKKPS